MDLIDELDALDEIVICDACGIMQDPEEDGLLFCSSCGAKFPEKESAPITCFECAATVPADSDFCEECGASVASAGQSPPQVGIVYQQEVGYDEADGYDDGQYEEEYEEYEEEEAEGYEEDYEEEEYEEEGGADDVRKSVPWFEAYLTTGEVKTGELVDDEDFNSLADVQRQIAEATEQLEVIPTRHAQGGRCCSRLAGQRQAIGALV